MTQKTAWLGATVVLLASLIAAGCGSSGPKPAELVDFKATLRVAKVWHVQVGASGPYVLAPAFVDDSVVAASASGDLWKIRADNGKVVWRVRTGARFSGGVGVGENLVLAGTAKGVVLAFDLEGKPLWNAKVSSKVVGVPLPAGDVVVVRTGDNRVVALDARDGSRRWLYQANQPPLTLRASPAMTRADKLIVAGMPAGRVIALDLANGGLVWEAAVGIPKGDNEIERITDIAGRPTVEDGQICAVAFQGRVACYETQKGSQVWARAASSATSLGSDAKSLYLSEAEGAVQALDKKVGTSLWRQDRLAYRELSAPVVHGGHVVVGDLSGYLHYLRIEDGGFAARVDTDGSAIAAAPLDLVSRLLVQTRNGGLYAFEIKR
ncbi:MAG: outer membrane protein assembly factor BamB [Burkholderiales bacterium]